MKKARAWLDSHGMVYGFHDYKTKRQQSGEQNTNTWRSVTALVNPVTEPTRR